MGVPKSVRSKTQTQTRTFFVRGGRPGAGVFGRRGKRWLVYGVPKIPSVFAGTSRHDLGGWLGTPKKKVFGREGGGVDLFHTAWGVFFSMHGSESGDDRKGQAESKLGWSWALYLYLLVLIN